MEMTSTIKKFDEVTLFFVYRFDSVQDLIDPKASEQVLQLIVKIAEHPATWKQIHRVLGNPF